MIHAFLFLTKKGYSRDGTDGHGPVIVYDDKLIVGFQEEDEGDQ
jgi:hypothetical protein